MTATDSHVATPAPRGISPITAVALVLIGAALVAVVWGLGAPLTLTVDGVTRTVAPGTIVADLSAKGFIRAKPGTLYSINGGIESPNGGNPPSFWRNGREVADDARVYSGDVIVGVDGTDVIERIVTTRVSIDPTATIRGTGVLLKVVDPGKPGTALERKGAISGELVSTTVLVPASNIVLEASMPASTDKLVALTFDDGPWPGSTDKIVSVLTAEGVPSTFFELGEQVVRWPSLSRAVASAGDEIGDHSWSHPFLTKLKAAAVRKQIADTSSAVRSVTGTPTTLFRPPYGAINRTVWAQAKALHQQVVLWDVDALDWTRPGVSKIVSNVTSHVGRASIVLMHDGGGDRSETLAALPSIIHWLKSNGYTFVTVSQMLAAR